MIGCGQMERPSYVSTVLTDGHSYWQRGSNPQLQYETPVGGPKEPPDSYRVTNMHLGQTEEINQINETEKVSINCIQLFSGIYPEQP